MKLARLLALGSVATALLASTNSFAQETTFYLDRAQLSGAPDDGFMVWRPHLHEKTRFYGSLAVGYTLNPLRRDNITSDGNAQENIEMPVSHQVISYAMVGAEVANWVGINLAIPVALYQKGATNLEEEGVLPNGFGMNAQALHDPRLDLRTRLYRSDDRKFILGVNGGLFLPLGDGASMASDSSVGALLQLSSEYDLGWALLAGQLGPHFRTPHDFAELTVGNELRYAFGGYAPIGESGLRLGVELFGSVGIGEADGRDTTFAGDNVSVEWLGQAKLPLDQKRRWWFQGGAGTRLSTGYGAPDLRVLAQVGYWFPIEDTDPKTFSQGYRSAPDVTDHAKDTDGDGFPDDVDLCPTIKEDGKPPLPADGCPEDADRDHDGIPDRIDQCPDDPEDKDGIEDKDGCPEDDADNDKIPDVEDKCPTEPGPRSEIAEKNGCPQLTRLEDDGTIALLEPIRFETGKSTIKAESFPILDEVYALMTARPEIRLGVYGHTDSVGSDANNLTLSKSRAKACVDYLIKKGAAANRLESEGYGESKPITTNETAEGKAKNRRTEFKILNQEE